MSRKLKRTQERHYSAHHMLIRAASIALDRARKQNSGWLYDQLGAMTFAALAIEALCNSIGDRLIDGWKSDFETASPNAKLRILAKQLNIRYDKKIEPWSGALELIKFRNRVAHAKPQVVTEEKFVTQEELDRCLFDAPQSALEKMITAANAERAVRTVEEIKDLLVEKLSVDQRQGLTFDGWTDSASHVD